MKNLKRNRLRVEQKEDYFEIGIDEKNHIYISWSRYPIKNASNNYGITYTKIGNKKIEMKQVTNNYGIWGLNLTDRNYETFFNENLALEIKEICNKYLLLDEIKESNEEDLFKNCIDIFRKYCDKYDNYDDYDYENI